MNGNFYLLIDVVFIFSTFSWWFCFRFQPEPIGGWGSEKVRIEVEKSLREASFKYLNKIGSLFLCINIFFLSHWVFTEANGGY